MVQKPFICFSNVLWILARSFHTRGMSPSRVPKQRSTPHETSCKQLAYLALALGDFLALGPFSTFKKRLAYNMRFLYRPTGAFFLSSAFAIFGVCFRTLPARANDPWTFPILCSVSIHQSDKTKILGLLLVL